MRTPEALNMHPDEFAEHFGGFEDDDDPTPAPELCEICGESICDDDVAGEMDGAPVHASCKDKFLAQLEAHEARKGAEAEL
jgi:hypothetical protein